MLVSGGIVIFCLPNTDANHAGQLEQFCIAPFLDGLNLRQGQSPGIVQKVPLSLDRVGAFDLVIHMVEPSLELSLQPLGRDVFVRKGIDKIRD